MERKFQCTNIVSVKLGNEILAPMQYNGTTDAPPFEQWLLSCLSQDTVIVMDNTSFHSKNKLFKISKKHHRTIIFLLPYSPKLKFLGYFKALAENAYS